MVKLTFDMVRKKAEHHDDLLESLAELSLHQCNLTSLSTALHHTPKLQILYLHNNLLTQQSLVGLRKLRSLLYLNLTLNNLTAVDHLYHCEKLVKLDLTLNFVALSALRQSLEALRRNQFLNELFLTGNPCTQWSLYRLYAIHSLPQIAKLDGREVTRSERIEAGLHSESEWQSLLDSAIASLPAAKESKESDTVFTPAMRLKQYEESKRIDERKAELERERNKVMVPENLWHAAQEKLNIKVNPQELQEDQLPSQRNLAKLEFTLSDSSDGRHLVLDLAVPKYLDSSLIDVDLYANWLQVVVKGKLFVLHTGEPVSVTESAIQRVQSNGHLIVKMKKVNGSGSAKKPQTEANAIPVNAHQQPAASKPVPGSRAYREMIKKLDEEHAATIKQVSAKRSDALEQQRRDAEARVEAEGDDEVPPLM